MQIKTMRHHYTPTRMVKIQNTENTKCWQGCRTTITYSLLVGMQNGTATLETVWMFLIKLNILLPYTPAIALISIYSNDLKFMSTQKPVHNIYSSIESLTVKNVPLWSGILIVGKAACVRGQGVYGNSVLYAQFCCEPKIALKYEVYFKKWKEK